MLKILMFVGALFGGCANAQTLPNGTIDVYFQQLSRGGVMEGCSLVFTALTQDTAYLKGAQVTMNGSIAVRTIDGLRLSFTGKLGTRVFDSTISKSTWTAPHYFYFTTTNGTTAGKVKVVAGETPGYKLLIGSATDDAISSLVLDIAKTGRFVAGFNRKAGGQDVYSIIDISTSLKQGPDGAAQITTNANTQKDFDGCFVRLISDLRAKLEAPPAK